MHFNMASSRVVCAGILIVCEHLINECRRLISKKKKRKIRSRRARRWLMRRNTLGASECLLREWSLEDEEMLKNHLRMSELQFE
jgi:hypothetical protein